MNVDAAADLCRHFEGFRAQPYLCPAGVPTQGYGTVYRPDGRRVAMDDPPIDKATAEAWLQAELRHNYGAGVVRLCPGLIAHPGPFNAAVDFAYNLGVGRLQTSTLRRKLNAQDWDGAAEELRKWVRGGGRVLPGLVRRREAECKLLGV